MTGERDSLWWLSFAGEEGFRGVIITRAFEFLDAVRKTHVLGINPGGQVKGAMCPPENEHLVRDADVDRLLTREEIMGPPYNGITVRQHEAEQKRMN